MLSSPAGTDWGDFPLMRWPTTSTLEFREMQDLESLVALVPMIVPCAQSCLTVCDPMDCSLPDSSVHGILQA